LAQAGIKERSSAALAAMPRVALLAAAVVAAVAASSTSDATTALAPGDRVLPITKVVNLLKEMQKDVEMEAKKDKDTYEAMACWCQSNEKAKTEGIEVYNQQIDGLESFIEAKSGKHGELETQIKQIKEDVVENEELLKKATALRKEEAAAFHKQETELLTSVQLLRGAITALSKHHPNLIQSDTEDAVLRSLRPQLRKLVHRHLPILGFLRDPAKKEAVLAFLDANEDILEPDNLGTPSFLQRTKRTAIPVFKSYAPQSGQIMGVLRQMKDAFEADLPAIQQDEAKKAEAFALLMGEKESMLAQLKASYKEKWAMFSETNVKLVEAKADLKDARRSLSADRKFMLELTERCKAADYEYERRSTMRSEEIAAVAQAISILTTDTAKDAQQTTFGKSFFQLAAMHRPLTGLTRRDQVVALLEKASSQHRELALLAALARTDPFEKVVKAIDELMARLNTEQANEVKQRDYCINQLHENEVETERTKAELKSLESKLAELTQQAETLTSEIAELKAQIRELRVELQRASEDRKAENLEFRMTVKGQKEAQEALKMAYEKLAAVYVKSAALMQQEPVEAPANPGGPAGKPVGSDMPELEDYSQHSSSNSVLTLIKKLIGEAKVIEDEATSDEQNAQTAYEKLVADTNDSVDAKTREIADKSAQLATTEKEMHLTSAEKKRTAEALVALGETRAAIHGECDFLLKNFDLRQSSRAAEMDALAEAKAIVSGMRETAL